MDLIPMIRDDPLDQIRFDFVPRPPCIIPALPKSLSTQSLLPFLRFLKYLIAIGLTLVTLLPGKGISDDSGTFRARWWSYYQRGLERVEKADWQNALSDLKKAISMRSKDQRMARTYGMHFIDYFPHRELGILHLNRGEIDEAIRELEESLRAEESAKAVYYLNKARRIRLMDQKEITVLPPSITLYAPLPGAVLKDASVVVKGNVVGKGLISRIVIGGIPYRFDRAEDSIDFAQEISIDEGANRIIIAAGDLLGNRSEIEIPLTGDREGPAITIEDIFLEEKDGQKFVRVRGDVSDGAGIRTVVIQNKEIEAGNVKTYRFDLTFPEEAKKDRLIITAFDILGNATTAGIDIEREITAFNKNEQPVLLASNVSQLFSSDKDPPVITLREADDLPPVFVDKYYVEGEANDNRAVERILINNKQITTQKGKKVFFSKTTPLREGANRITVEAYDTSGNKAATELMVKREIPTALQIGSRMTLTLLPFHITGNASLGHLAYGLLTDSFVAQKRFNLLERAKLEQVLLEQKLAGEKLTDLKHSIRVGKIMSADSILSTSLKEDPKSLEIISRIINTVTSEIMDVKDVYSEDKSPAAVKELMDGLASKIARGFPLTEGLIIKKGSKEVYTDVGASAKTRRHTGVIICRKGEEIKHPVTGKSLGQNIIKLGEGYIEEIHEGFSKVRVSDKLKDQDIKIKDMVITK